MVEILVGALVIVGSMFMFLAAIGVVRMPDIYMRMSTVTKAATMGAGLMLIGAVIEASTTTAIVKAVALVTFGFLTSPIAAHMIGRAAYARGVPLWEGTLLDQMKDHPANSIPSFEEGEEHPGERPRVFD